MADRQSAVARVSRTRGQPLVFLATVVVLWGSARTVHYMMPAGVMSTAPSVERQHAPGKTPATTAMRLAPARNGMMALLGLQANAAVPGTPHRPPAQPVVSPASIPVEIALAHQRMWIESLVGGGTPGHGSPGSPLVDRPLHFSPPDATSPAATTVSVAGSSNPKRESVYGWSVYGWSLLRQGSQAPVLAAGGQYGGSQAGLVVRLALGTSARSPSLYARATSALASSDDRSVAFGMTARPWPGVPVDLAVERRLGLGDGQRDQFAAMLVGGASITDQRSGVQFEGYGQAGIIGLTESRGFFDLQMLASRRVVTQQRGAVSIGAGLWAGGQQDIAAAGEKSWLHRVDVGPRAVVTLPVDKSELTLALDWRQRIDGDAHPPSGAAITLSAGF